MKRIIVVLFILSAVLCGCGKSDYDESLLGKWEFESNTYLFYKNGCVDINTSKYKYSANKDSITLYVGDGEKTIPYCISNDTLFLNGIELKRPHEQTGENVISDYLSRYLTG